MVISISIESRLISASQGAYNNDRLLKMDLLAVFLDMEVDFYDPNCGRMGVLGL